jgi:hypothetical protein
VGCAGEQNRFVKRYSSVTNGVAPNGVSNRRV